MAPSGTLHVHAVIDSLSFGGAELLLGDMAAAASEAGIRLTVGYLREADGSPAAARLRANGVEPVPIRMPPHLYPSAFTRVHQHLREMRPDVVHTHLGYADLLGGLAARTLGIPSVSTVHEMAPGHVGAMPRRERAKEWLMTTVRTRCAAQVIAVSDGARESYLSRSGDRPEHVVTIHNGMSRRAEPGAGARVRAELGIDADALVVATLSTLRPVKAHEVAVGAAGLLWQRWPGLKLLVVGEGPAREAVEAEAAPWGELVIMTGFRHDTMAVLDAVDVLLHPSHIEAFPTTLLEAMAAGVPVVATAVGGIPEIVAAGETGLLVAPPPNVDAVADAAAKLLGDPAARRRMGTAAAARFSREFDGVAWMARTRAVYERAIRAAR